MLAAIRQGLTVPTVLSLGVHGALAFALAGGALTQSTRSTRPQPAIAIELLAPQVVAAPSPISPPLVALPPPRASRSLAVATPIAAPAPIPIAALPPTSASATPTNLESPVVVPTAATTTTTTTATPTTATTTNPTPPSGTARSAPNADANPTRGAGPSVDLGHYTNALGRAIARHRRYPEMAAQLGQEGTALVLVHLRRDGSLHATPRVVESSGFDLLDREAVAMVGRAAPFAALPDGYRDAVAELRVPVRFHLED